MTIYSKIKYSPFYFLSLMPWPILYLISDSTFIVLYYIVGYRKKVIESNLKIAFPNQSDREINQTGKKFLRFFCTMMIESLKTLTLSEKSIKKHFKLKNPELAQKYFDEGRNVTLYAAHQGNWEWLGLLPNFVPHQVTSFYQPLSNKYFDGLMLLIRSRFGVICIPSDKGYRTITKMEQDNIKTMNIIIGDQRPKGKSSVHRMPLFGKETNFLIGADRIASKGKHVVIFPAFTRTKRGYYELEFQLITDQPIAKNDYSVIEDYAKRLEKAIEKSPRMWLWSHKRWKEVK